METTVTVRMTNELHDRLEEVSMADKRRVGEMARLIIEEFLPVVQARLARRQQDEQ
jgi:predicted transcriptional regulator